MDQTGEGRNRCRRVQVTRWRDRRWGLTANSSGRVARRQMQEELEGDRFEGHARRKEGAEEVLETS